MEPTVHVFQLILLMFLLKCSLCFHHFVTICITCAQHVVEVEDSKAVSQFKDRFLRRTRSAKVCPS